MMKLHQFIGTFLASSPHHGLISFGFLVSTSGFLTMVHIAIIKEIPGLRPCFDLLAFRTPARVSGADLLRLLGQKHLSGKAKSFVESCL